MTLTEPSTVKPAALWKRPEVFRLLLIALLAEIGYAVLNISTMPVYLKYDRGFGEAVIGLVLMAFLLSEAVFKSPMGNLADRIGRKRLIVIGPSITIFTALATMVVPHNYGSTETLMLVTLRALDGLGAAMLWPAAFALMSDSVDDGERQQAMSLLNMCYLIGIALALPIGGAVNDLIGPSLKASTGERSPSLFLAAILFVGVVTTAYTKLPSGRAKREQRQRKSTNEEPSVKDLANSFHRIPQYLILAAVTFAGIGFPMAIVKLFAEEQFKMGESSFGLLAMPTALAMASFSVPMSKLGERIGRSRAVHLGMGLCAAGLLLISLGAFLPFFRQTWVLAIGGMPIGVGFLLAIPAWFASVSDLDSERRAANIGAVMTAQGLGAIIGMPIGSAMYERLQFIGLGADFGRYSPFLGCTVCITCGWLISLKALPSRIAPGKMPETWQ